LHLQATKEKLRMKSQTLTESRKCAMLSMATLTFAMAPVQGISIKSSFTMLTLITLRISVTLDTFVGVIASAMAITLTI